MIVPLLVNDQTPKLDEIWIKKLINVWPLVSLSELEGDRQERDRQKQLFMAGEVRNPTLKYTGLQSRDLKSYGVGLRELLAEIEKEEKSELVKDVYRGAIEEKLKLLRMLRCVQEGDAVAFSQASIDLYEQPSQEIFCQLVSELKAKEQGQDADGRLDNLPECPSADSSDWVGDSGLADRVLGDWFGELRDLVPDKSEFVAKEIVAVFQKALVYLELPDWQALVAPDGQVAIRVNHVAKMLSVPPDRRVSKIDLTALLIHEVGTHIVRSVNGARSPLCLLGIGLAGYERGEEGIAMMREQAIYGRAQSFVRAERYLAIGLGLGLDGKPRDFREVFEILRAYFRWQNEEEREAAEKAWRVTLRAFRGTDGQQKGNCFVKDVIYQHGYIDLWKMLRDRLGEIDRFRAGKYDPTNQSHLEVLDELGVS